MVNQNIHTMKQPELGKRISELRKQKGLTQEELVEQCNINVRTIQRIEAGEVNPRSYTIKTILNVLGVSYVEENNEDKVIFTRSQKRLLNLAWIFGVIYFVIGFIETAADFYQFSGDASFLNTAIYAVVKFVSGLSFALFFIGFYTLAKVYNHHLLKFVTIALITVLIVSNSIDVFSSDVIDETIAIRLVLESLVFGGLQLMFGIGLYQMKDKLGKIAQVNGILEIIVGACLATVLLATLGMFLLIPTLIIEIILLYRLANK